MQFINSRAFAVVGVVAFGIALASSIFFSM
jgi:hypothetical protein